MSNSHSENIPVIVGVGEYVDRPETLEQALEALALMAHALKAADADAGGGFLKRVESLELIGLMSWPYEDPVSQLCTRLDISPARTVNASMGGETPIRLVYEAAVRIAKGELSVAAIVGGEAMHTAARLAKAGGNMGLAAMVSGEMNPSANPGNWTPPAPRDKATRFASSSFEMSPIAEQLDVVDPARVYPLYEMAAQAAWNQTPAQGMAESAQLWSMYASVAADNPTAWLSKGATAEEISAIGPKNRLINWPYPKLMTANPMVNQAAAVIVTSLAAARAAGIAEDRIVHIWGSAQAREPEDWLKRDRYDHSAAQLMVLNRVMQIAGGSAEHFGPVELYSCFPVVPKMALRALGKTSSEISPTVAGGLTFFGGPLNNYMTHALCAMVRKLRENSDKPGMLYGQGGYVNKHHAMLLSTHPAPTPLSIDDSVQAEADTARDPIPEVLNSYEGPASIETYTVAYGRDGQPLHGLVVLRTPEDKRTLAKVPSDDEASLSLLLSTQCNAIGNKGRVRIDAFGDLIWEAGDQPRDRSQRKLKYCTVEREGHLSIITINRPELMNALHPQSNAELQEVFDEFDADPDQWVAILTGAGAKAFSAGNDLKYMSMAMMRGDRISPPLKGFAGLTARFDMNKPVIAAVNGVAMGGGFEIALACDVILAADTASFALPEPKVGIAALAGGLLRLPRQIGEKRAMEMILTARKVSASEGETLGFVNKVVPAAELMSEARSMAKLIIANSPMSIRASKEVVREGLNQATIAKAYAEQQSYPAVEALFKSGDIIEGPTAFAQKRAPKWSGQ